jgi:hypothetical protein
MTYDDDEVGRILEAISTGHRATDLLLDAMKEAAKLECVAEPLPCGVCLVCAAQKVVQAREENQP